MQSAAYLEENGKPTESDTDLNSPISEVKDSVEEESLREQLFKTEEEIVTLRQVLNVKLKLAQDLKRQLGITAINEMKEDIIHGINTIKESNTFKATTVAMKNVKDKTSTTLSTASTKFSQKLGMLRNTNTFKSIEGKMGNAYTSVKQSKSMGSIPNKLKVPCKYNPGDKIFAKVKGFVYWPARVNPLPSDIVIPPNKIPIFFYGTHEVFFISPTSCWPFDEKNKAKWGKPKSRAHFNQGMDEIENHSTIYQYGADPSAEDFLAQFYEFKRANGQNTTPNKLKNNNDDDSAVSKDESNTVSDKEQSKSSTAVKKRNKSGSSLSMKENKNNSKPKAMTELSVDEVKSEEINEIAELSQSIAAPKKRQRSGSALSSKENTNCDLSVANDSEIIQTDVGVTTRKRQSSGTSEMNKSGKSRSVSRKRQRNTAVKKEIKIDESDDKPKKDLDKCDVPSSNVDPILTSDEVKIESFSDYVVKLENNLDDKLISKMISKEDVETDDKSVKSDDSYHSDHLTTKTANPKPRRSKSSSTKVENKTEDESDSLSVDSDNPEDEDFRPATKTKRLTKKIKSPKPKKPNVKKSVITQPKRVSVGKTPIKKKVVSSKAVSDGSLSSLSSVEEWNVADDKLKEVEEKTKLPQVQRLQLNDTLVKDAKIKPKENKKNFDKTTLENEQIKTENHKCEEVNKEKLSNQEVNQIDDSETVESNSLEKEIVVKILKSDMNMENIRETTNQINENKEIVSLNNEDKIDKQEEQCQLSNDKTNNKRSKKGKFNEALDLDDGNQDISEPANDVSSKSVEASSTQEKIKKVKINLKEMKVTKSKSKQQSNRKRNRKLSSSSDSDIEIIRKDDHKSISKKVKLYEKSSESDDNSKKDKVLEKVHVDKLQILQNFNVDIRSCLVLGHEDYKKCLERFKSLCEMDIDLLSLVRVWQLMDTVKKCRRYKRNEQIKNEAQAVYKRFMDIYSQASKEEISKAQSLLAQYRHQNNIQNQNVGNASNKTNGGLVIPISVADMFQNKPPNQSEFNNKHNKDESVISKRLSESVTNISFQNKNVTSEPQKSVVEEINEEEKMRLLSIDLEAKVSDILNKIEKNSDMMNQKSLSHLLPSTDESTMSIQLPTQWKSVNDKSVEKDKYVDVDNSDEDEDDVEAIVRRIEEVPIKLPEPELLFANNGNGSSSALDARIENLFNNSFISSTKDVRQKKSRVSSSRHHNKNNAKSTSPLRMTSFNQKLDIQESVVIKNSEKETASVNELGLVENQKDDIEIYDLLGV